MDFENKNTRNTLIFRFLLYYRLVSEDNKEYSVWLIGVWGRIIKEIPEDHIQKVIDKTISKYPRNNPPSGDDLLEIWKKSKPHKMFKPEKIYNNKDE